MSVDTSIRPLAHADVVRMAREQAEAREPMHHPFDVGTTEAITYERHYLARQRELEEHED